MDKPFYVHAKWDDEANVWVASSDDVPGLVTEADTTAERGRGELFWRKNAELFFASYFGGFRGDCENLLRY